MTVSVAITAIVTANRRIERTIETIERIQRCTPPPQEIIVHVDVNQIDCATGIRTASPPVRIIVSEQNIGPGGGRNLFLAAAHCIYVASFDDNSYPVDRDYFARIANLFEAHAQAAVLAADVYHQGEEVATALAPAPRWVNSFPGGGCAYHRSMFFATTGCDTR